jgi:carbonic anhydrase
MRKLLKGLREFQSNVFPEHQDLFEQLAHGQKPSVLFISCSDSRILPNLITQSNVGEIFAIRNVGNIIPPYGAAKTSEGAAIEYAIQALGIEQVIVCGHSDCGAMKGLLKIERLREEMPLVYEWLQNAEATRRLVKESYQGCQGADLVEIAIAENVLSQIHNLQTYPIVHTRLRQGRLQINGWIYEIETGEVLIYDEHSHTFLPSNSLALNNYSSPPKTNPLPISCQMPESISKALENHNPDLVPWLPQAQSDRIFRGSKHSSH